MNRWLGLIAGLALGAALSACDRKSEPALPATGQDSGPGNAGSGIVSSGQRTQRDGQGLAGGLSGNSGLGLTGSFPSATPTQAGASDGGGSSVQR